MGSHRYISKAALGRIAQGLSLVAMRSRDEYGVSHPVTLDADNTAAAILEALSRISGSMISVEEPAPLTHEYVTRVLHYDPLTGIFTWRMSPSRSSKVGARAGYSFTKERYSRITLRGHRYLEHRLAWFWVYGAWPKSVIDHVNGDGFDNRLSNLREATPSQNNFNKPLQKNNTSGVRGVSYNKNSNRWKAVIGVSKKKILLGFFESKEEAAQAYRKAAELHAGEFLRLQ